MEFYAIYDCVFTSHPFSISKSQAKSKVIVHGLRTKRSMSNFADIPNEKLKKTDKRLNLSIEW
jgi:hypothetical protein